MTKPQDKSEVDPIVTVSDSLAPKSNNDVHSVPRRRRLATDKNV